MYNKSKTTSSLSLRLRDVCNSSQNDTTFLTSKTLFSPSTGIQRVIPLYTLQTMFVAVFGYHTRTFHAPLILLWISTVVHNQEGAIQEVAM